jgi:hypothetical protein
MEGPLVKFDRAGIAERLRGLLSGQDGGDLGKTAARLGIEELSLRMSVDEESPHPTVEVLAAVVRSYGVDPTWLLTGVYDGSTHRHSMETLASITAELRAFVNKRSRLISDPPSENFHLSDN